jgi:hypothetical protein
MEWPHALTTVSTLLWVVSSSFQRFQEATVSVADTRVAPNASALPRDILFPLPMFPNELPSRSLFGNRAQIFDKTMLVDSYDEQMW